MSKYSNYRFSLLYHTITKTSSKFIKFKRSKIINSLHFETKRKQTNFKMRKSKSFSLRSLRVGEFFVQHVIKFSVWLGKNMHKKKFLFRIFIKIFLLASATINILFDKAFQIFSTYFIDCVACALDMEKNPIIIKPDKLARVVMCHHHYFWVFSQRHFDTEKNEKKIERKSVRRKKYFLSI